MLKVKVFNKCGTGAIGWLHIQEIPASKSPKASEEVATMLGPRRNLIHRPPVLQSQGTLGAHGASLPSS